MAEPERCPTCHQVLPPEPSPTDRCAQCRNTYGNTAKPVWAFDRQGRPVGTLHTSCAQLSGSKGPYLPLYLTVAGNSQESARFSVWQRYIAGGIAVDTERWYAVLLVDEPAETLTAQQEEQLAWWVSAGPKKMGAAWGERVRAAYADLVREYRAWKAEVDGR